MALTGQRDGPPALSGAPVLAMLGEVTEQLARVTGRTGSRVRADPAELLTARAAFARLTRQGRVSAGGASRLLRSADGWCAVTLSRPDDVAAVPAILGTLGHRADEARHAIAESHAGGESHAGAWGALEAAALTRPAAVMADAAQLLGVPAAALPADAPARRSAPWPPWRVSRIAAPAPAARLEGAVVADLSSMWAGPLCARLLSAAGAHVVKVETPGRPDGARAGDPEFFGWLHAGHRSLLADFSTAAGRDALARLLSAADVVIEASRPRALANLGLAPETVAHRSGQVWLSITGYGRARPERVAFGDDAAVAGGLVGWAQTPVFCADAIADPLTGVCGALAVAMSVAAGGGQLIDLAMSSVAASFAAAPGCDHGPHEVRQGTTVTCALLDRAQKVLPPRRPRPAGGAAPGLGADTTAVLAWLAGHDAAGPARQPLCHVVPLPGYSRPRDPLGLSRSCGRATARSLPRQACVIPAVAEVPPRRRWRRPDPLKEPGEQRAAAHGRAQVSHGGFLPTSVSGRRPGRDACSRHARTPRWRRPAPR